MTDSEHSQERLIEVCLDEVLGGVTPPDLADKILQRHSAADVSEPEPPPVVRPPVAAYESASSQEVATAHYTWQWVMIAATLLLTVSIVTFFATRRGTNDSTNTADVKDSSQPPTKEKTADTKKSAPQLVPSDKQNKAKQSPAIVQPETKGSQQLVQQNKRSGGSTTNPQRQLAPRSDLDVVALVNQTIRNSWKKQSLAPAEPAPLSKWVRRVYVRLVGRIPDPQELDEFLKSNTPLAQRKAVLVVKLQQTDEYAQNWANYWTTVLIGRFGGRSPGDLADRNGLRRFLFVALKEKRSYKEIFQQLITAVGSNRPGSKDFNGATNFLLAGYKKDSILATSRTSRVFLGKQLSCVRCHNHPSNQWDQHHFWTLNAFFQQMQAERDKDNGAVRLVDRDSNRNVFYEFPNGKLKVAFPSFPADQPVAESAKIADVNLRKELAERIPQSQDFSRSLVNRLWSHFFGYGFTRPIDDMGPHNRPIQLHGKLLTELAQEFHVGGHNLDRVVRWMVLSEPFTLSSRVPEKTTDDPLAGTPMFSHYYARQMEPEEVYRSLLVAARAYKKGDFQELEKAQRAWLGQYSRKFHGSGKSDSVGQQDIRQSLVMMNGPLMKRLTAVRPGSVLHLVKASKMSDDKKIEHLFMSAVARKPDRREARLAKSMLEKNRDTALQDIWWALLNSSEFVLDH